MVPLSKQRLEAILSIWKDVWTLDITTCERGLMKAANFMIIVVKG